MRRPRAASTSRPPGRAHRRLGGILMNLRRSADTMAPAQSAAWDAYLAVSRDLLPTVYDMHAEAATINVRLGRAAKRILRHAPLWGDHGSMLCAALDSAVRLHRDGDRSGLAELVQAMGDRLFLLTIDPGLPQRGSRDHRPS